MKPHQQLRRIKASERCYHWLIWLYPAPFRAAFGQSMRQVFRDQCLDAIERKGGWGLVVLWLRTLLDFAWTCPKEHVVALPTLPRRGWDQFARKPVWFYPALLTTACFLVALLVAYSAPPYHSSSAMLMVRVLLPANNPAPVNLTNPSQAESMGLELLGLELPHSPAVMYPVIEKLGLQEVYQTRLGVLAPPTIEEAHELLVSRVKLHQNAHSSVFRITVHDEDKHRAKTIAEALVYQCLQQMLTFVKSEPEAQGALSTALPHVSILKNPEESDQKVRPEFRDTILSGGKIGLGGGGLVFVLALTRRWRDRRLIQLAPN